MFDPDQYALLDFGGGRKLERFGSRLLDRPSPAAEHATVADAEQWEQAAARYDSGGGRGGNGGGRRKGSWATEGSPTESADDEDGTWPVRHAGSRLLMQLGDSGNVGLFPEQAGNWEWIADEVRRCAVGLVEGRPRVLNLFAYTGAASLAAAAAGAEVVHVDSSAPTVAWAKRNAEASGMAELPVRWLVDDAMKFVRRECKRGNFYNGIIADPPTYGHGPKGKAFKFDDSVPELMNMCGQLLSWAEPRFLLFSCHVPGVGPLQAASLAADALRNPGDHSPVGESLTLNTSDGRTLDAGVCARWSSDDPN